MKSARKKQDKKDASATKKSAGTKAAELRGKDIAALEKEVSELLKAHFGLRMQRATQQLTNHTQLGRTRRDVARVKTVIAEKRRAQQQPQESAK